MSKRIGVSFILIGVVLVLSALLLFVLNEVEDDKAGLTSNFYLDNVKNYISGQAAATSDQSNGENSDDRETAGNSNTPEDAEEMPVSIIDGHGFIGYITIPSLDIELPVLADWDYNKLDISPCRQTGSIVTDDLVIAAHNYTSHFAKLEYIEENAEVTFTTMNGKIVKYAVTEIQILDGKAVEEVLGSSHDLVLYTCTYEGTTRIVVFCDRT